MIALRRANEVRVARAKLKQDLRDGKVSIGKILASPPEHIATAQVLDLLVAVPKIGPVKAARILRRCFELLIGAFAWMPMAWVRVVGRAG
jgi:hypothetical protein